MKKSSLLALVTLSSLVLSQAAFADETVDPVDPTSGVTVTLPSQEMSEPINETPASSTPIDATTAPEVISEPSTTGSSEITEDTTPSSTDNPVIPTDSSTVVNPVTEPSVEVPASSDQTKTEDNSQTEAEEETTSPADQSGTEEAVIVPTVDGGTAVLTPDVTVPTNNPNVSAQTAYDTGASQVGTTSQVTGQVVQNVTPTNPVYTSTGYQIVSTQNSQLVVANADGTRATLAPESIGATVNSDQTISVTTSTGELKTLPHTGEKEEALIGMTGAGLLALLGAYLFKKKTVKNS